MGSNWICVPPGPRLSIKFLTYGSLTDDTSYAQTTVGRYRLAECFYFLAYARVLCVFHLPDSNRTGAINNLDNR